MTLLHIIFASIFIPYFILLFYSKRYNNPYTLTFIFGKKGSGKSTLMIKMMLRDLKKGWTVYTDMEGVNISGIRKIDLRDLANSTPEPKSSVYLDEVGLSLDNRSYKTFPAGLRDWFALQRHYKCKVIVNSQVFDVDKKVRDRTDKFLYQCKIAGCIGVTRPIVLKVKPNDMSQPGNDNPIATCYGWGYLSDWRITWIPKYARYFNSFAIPDRPAITFETIPADLRELRSLPSRIRNRSAWVRCKASDLSRRFRAWQRSIFRKK